VRNKTSLFTRVLFSTALIGLVFHFSPIYGQVSCFTKADKIKIASQLKLGELCEQKQAEAIKTINLLNLKIQKLDKVLSMQAEKESVHLSIQSSLSIAVQLQSKALKQFETASKWDWKSFGIGLAVGLVSAALIAGVTSYLVLR
jgi:hypothetical protein